MTNSVPENPPLPKSLLDLVDALKSAKDSSNPITRENAQVRLGELVERAKTEVPSLAKLEFTHIWIPIGQILEHHGQNHFTDALTAYQLALEVFPLGESANNPNVWRARAVAWMNIGNIQQKLGDPKAGIAAYDTSLENLSRMSPSDTDAAIMAGALWLNRGSAVQRQNQQETLPEVVRSFQSAIDTLAPLDQSIPHVVHLGGAARLNLAAALLSGPAPQVETAYGLAQQVVANFANHEAAEPQFADISLRARKMICEIAGFRINNAGTDAQKRSENVGLGTDTAEEALKLTAHWDKNGVFGFRGIVGWFLQYALALYARFQPQFLSEFVVETLAGENTPADWRSAAELNKMALAGVQGAEANVQNELNRRTNPDEVTHLRGILESLKEARTSLSTVHT
ncbi:MAG TPA: tetratricopeptide repeat protein [Opitutaceae bacterium]|nr:tetratricopeptide repeat protein [Opitutaceae bacterium]